MKRLLAALACSFAFTAAAIEPSAGVAAVAAYRGADRTQKLIAGARKEGELMLYSSLTQEDQLRLGEDFRKRYGVTLKFWRGSQAHILQRATSEAPARRFDLAAVQTQRPQPQT